MAARGGCRRCVLTLKREGTTMGRSSDNHRVVLLLRVLGGRSDGGECARWWQLGEGKKREDYDEDDGVIRVRVM